MENNSNKLGKMPILKLMAAMSIPAMFSMLVQALYNIVDSVFVGMISDTDTEMLSLNIAFPLQMIFFAIALGIGIGTNSLISRKLGEGNHSEASNAALTGLFLGACAILVAIICSFFLPKIFLMIYDQPENVENMAIQYLSITMGFSFGMFAETIFNKILQSTGNMKIPMFSQLIGAITNIILDPIFIFKSGATYSAPFIGEFVMPFGFGLGVRGAAIATVISRYVECAVFIIYVFIKRKAYPFFKGAFRTLYIPKDLLKRITVKGTPLLVNEFLWAAGMSVLSMSYSLHGIAVVAGYSISSTVVNLLSISFQSLGSSISIIAGKLLGAGKFTEAIDTVKKMFAFTLFASVLVGISIFLLSKPILMLYNTSEESKMYAEFFMKTVALTVPIGVIAHASYFTLRSGGKTFVTFLFDSVFLLCFAVPLAFTLYYVFGLSIFIIFPIEPLTYF